MNKNTNSVNIMSMPTQEELCIKILEYVQNHSPKLYILTPCFGGVCYVNYVQSMIATLELFHQFGFPIQFEFCKSDSLITRARNNLIAKAMADTEMTHVLFIDNDLMWNPMNILKMILAEKGIVGGIYPLKKYHWSRLVGEDLSKTRSRCADELVVDDQNKIEEWLDKRNQSVLKSYVPDDVMIQSRLLSFNVNHLGNHLEIDDNLAKVRHIPTGFMLIQRSTIEKMHESFAETKYTDDVGFLTQEENKFAYALFECGVREGHYFSEDWMFCERWIQLGGDIWADVSISLTHTGIEDYRGSYLASLL
uniref:Glycosyltransferase 2-like domain-containing protein n=1 Tax=viral metagenome TaxID=1070528 RepID=A0A6C0HU14_9ZZZZ